MQVRREKFNKQVVRICNNENVPEDQKLLAKRLATKYLDMIDAVFDAGYLSMPPRLPDLQVRDIYVGVYDELELVLNDIESGYIHKDWFSVNAVEFLDATHSKLKDTIPS